MKHASIISVREASAKLSDTFIDFIDAAFHLRQTTFIQ